MKIIKVGFLFILLIIFLYLQNNILQVSHIKFESAKIPNSFDGFKIVQLSDLHEKEFGKANKFLIDKIKKEKPDMIVITGDLIDRRFYSVKIIDTFISRITQIAPVYYVTGNHEANSPYLVQLEKLLIKYNVKVLRNSSKKISLNGQFINITGIDDPSEPDMSSYSLNKQTLTKELNKALKENSNPTFNILLTHRPEHFPLYANFNFDLVFAGHAHGGQIRFPIIGGFFSPNQGFFPEYTSGKYNQYNSTMIVSRGLGNGSFPQRLFNQPEIIVTTLIKK